MNEQTVEPTEQQLIAEWDCDFEKYPLPICFDPREEQGELYLRSLRIRDDVREYIITIKQIKQ